MSEAKRLREEEQNAKAAQEAKQGEYNELKTSIDESKAAKDTAKKALDAINKQFEACEENKCREEL